MKTQGGPQEQHTQRSQSSSNSSVVEVVHTSPTDGVQPKLSHASVGHVNVPPRGNNYSPALVAQPQPESQWGAPSGLDGQEFGWQCHAQSTQQMHDIRSNPQLNATTSARMHDIENHAQGLGQGRVTGRCNVKGPQDPNPLTRWPNENFPIREGAKRPSYDELSQSVSGMLANVLELSLPMHRVAMIREIKAVMDTATTSGWPVAKSIFGDVMAKIESGCLQWTDEYALWQARVDAKSDVTMGFQRENSRSTHSASYQYYGQVSNTQAKRHIAQPYHRNYNWNFCRDHSDHNDVKLPQKYMHICAFCFSQPDVKDKRHKAKHCTNETPRPQ